MEFLNSAHRRHLLAIQENVGRGTVFQKGVWAEILCASRSLWNPSYYSHATPLVSTSRWEMESSRDFVEAQNVIPSHTLSQLLLWGIISQVPLGNILYKVWVDFTAKRGGLSALGENTILIFSPKFFQCCQYVSKEHRRWMILRVIFWILITTKQYSACSWPFSSTCPPFDLVTGGHNFISLFPKMFQ